jgi:hypothetical protein
LYAGIDNRIVLNVKVNTHFSLVGKYFVGKKLITFLETRIVEKNRDDDSYITLSNSAERLNGSYICTSPEPRERIIFPLRGASNFHLKKPLRGGKVVPKTHFETYIGFSGARRVP